MPKIDAGGAKDGSGMAHLVIAINKILAVSSALAWVLLVGVVLAGLIKIGGKIAGFPMAALALQPAELVGIGVFVFCSAFALK